MQCRLHGVLFVIQPLKMGKNSIRLQRWTEKRNLFNILNTLHSFVVAVVAFFLVSSLCCIYLSRHAFRNLDKLNRNDNEMNNGEVKRTQEYITRSGIHCKTCATSSSRGINTRNLFKKKNWTKINENACKEEKESRLVNTH